MIIDITGTILIPGNIGRNCPGNGECPGIECCCNECDYMLCCLEDHDPSDCMQCQDRACPHAPHQYKSNKLKNTKLPPFSVRRCIAFVGAMLYNICIHKNRKDDS